MVWKKKNGLIVRVSVRLRGTYMRASEVVMQLVSEVGQFFLRNICVSVDKSYLCSPFFGKKVQKIHN